MQIGSNLVENVDSLRSHVVDHFSTTFFNDGSTTNIGMVSRLISLMVSAYENNSLLAVLTFDEVRSIAFSMDPN